MSKAEIFILKQNPLKKHLVDFFTDRRKKAVIYKVPSIVTASLRNTKIYFY